MTETVERDHLYEVALDIILRGMTLQEASEHSKGGRKTAGKSGAELVMNRLGLYQQGIMVGQTGGTG